MNEGEEKSPAFHRPRCCLYFLIGRFLVRKSNASAWVVKISENEMFQLQSGLFLVEL